MKNNTHLHTQNGKKENLFIEIHIKIYVFFSCVVFMNFYFIFPQQFMSFFVVHFYLFNDEEKLL